MKDGKYRNWCFTSYIEPIKNVNCSYICYQKEECPKTKKIHWQGYIEFDNVKRLNEVKKVLNDNTVHLESRKGNQSQAIDYCKKLQSKVGDFYEEGTPKRQGNRSDLDSIYEAIDSGCTCKEILGDFKGSALRFIGCIQKALEVQHGLYAVDKYIMSQRHVESASSSEGIGSELNILRIPSSSPIASEVEGNTTPPTEALSFTDCKNNAKKINDKYKKIIEDILFDYN